MKPSTAKAKGRSTENELCEWIRSQGYDAERRRLNGPHDKGDITVGALPNLCIEVKSGAGPWKMTGWVRQTLTEMKNAEATTGLLAIRPPRVKGVDDWVGVTFDNRHKWEGVALPPLPWPQAHSLFKANPLHTFDRTLAPFKEELTMGLMAEIWLLVVAKASR